MRYLSVCSGIEAASVAWHPLGWEPVAFSEIDPFASAVLAARFPSVPNLGNMEGYRDWPIEPGSIDVLVGGTPCQSFSVAGLRKGLNDPRGNLALVYLGLVDRFRPRWIVWENVPGVLSSSGGRDFGAFLGGLAQLGYGFAYRVLDAQYVRVESHPYAVPQRRRRVFVVGHNGGDWQRAGAVLLEPEGVRGDPPTRRQAGQGATRGAAGGARGGGTAGTVAAKWAKGTRGPAGDEHHNLVPAVAGPLGGAAQRGGFRTTDLDNHGAFIPSGLFEPGYIHPRQTRNSQSTNQLGIKPHAKVADASTSEGPGAVLSTPSGFDFQNVALTGPVSGTLMGEAQKKAGEAGHGVALSSLATPAFAWPVEVADPITANEGDGPQFGEISENVTYTLNTHEKHAVMAIGFQSNLGSQGGDVFEGVSPPVRIGSSGDNKGNPPAVAFKASHYTRGKDGAPASVMPPLSADADKGDQDPLVAVTAPTLTSTNDPSRSPQSAEVTQQVHAVHTATMQVRRLTPRECERLQGFPDDWTAITYKGKPAADGPRYKALGNSMAVNVMAFIGERIDRMGKSEHTLSTNDEVCTPAAVYDRIVEILGPIGFDPCSHPASTVPSETQVLLPRYWTDPLKPCPAEESGGEQLTVYGDGLSFDWSGMGLVYVNPPYSLLPKQPWVRKAREEADEAVLLLPVRTAGAWWQDEVTRCSAVTFLRGRVQHDGEEHGAPFHQALVYCGPRADLWLAKASALGWTVRAR